MAKASSNKKVDLKVVLLGPSDAGKTSLIQRYINGSFNNLTTNTIGATFLLKQWGPYNVAVWDTAGEERFMGLSSFYCRSAGAAILAFDLTCSQSFHALQEKFLGLLNTAEPGCLKVLVGCKADCLDSQERKVRPQDCQKLALELNPAAIHIKAPPYFETSSLNGKNVDQVFDFILSHCLPLSGPKAEAKRAELAKRRIASSTVNLEQTKENNKANKCAC